MTAIDATYNAGDSSTPPHVRVAVSSAPTPPSTAYVSDFTTPVSAGSGPIDGWSITSGDSGPAYIQTVNEGTETGDIRLRGDSNTTTPLIVSRQLTGLTIGAEYYFRVRLPSGGLRRGRYSISVKETTATNTVGYSGWLKPSTTGSVETIVYFTAPVTNPYIQLRVYQNVQTSGLDYAAYDFDGIRVRPSGSWTIPTLTRTDANGTDTVVRLYQNGETEATTAAYTIYDWEAAHTGTVSYTFTDGLEATATDSVDVTSSYAGSGPLLLDSATGQYLTAVVPDYLYPELITGLDATRDFSGSVHEVVGRSDKIANPGPLRLRDGILDFHCTSYAKVLELLTIVEAGHVLWLAQADYPSMDMHFVPRQVGIRAEEATQGPRRWTVSVAFDEVNAP